MRRWLVLFFAVLLPLQFGWSAASAYCQHEASPQHGEHLGHHFHAHQAEGDAQADQRSGGGEGKSAFSAHADCASCHAAGAAVMLGRLDAHRVPALGAGAAPTAAPPFSSALARAPDRPQWRRLV